MVTGGRAGGQLIGNLTPAAPREPTGDPFRPRRCGPVPPRRLAAFISSVPDVNSLIIITFSKLTPTRVLGVGKSKNFASQQLRGAEGGSGHEEGTHQSS